ncbi:MAG: hypothetical protein JXQ80_03670 [Bacteroidales bacterium]|nr:hypothetical protein [Bacteroidales bacterium]
MKVVQFFTGTSSLLILLFLLAGCSGNAGNNKSVPTDSVAVAADIVIGNETRLLIKDLAENGDYVNSREFPSLIKAAVVYEQLGSNQLVIDLRTASQYSGGHIKGAVNKQFSELPAYFETGIKPFTYEKIVLVCDDGQLSGYTTSLLRLMGYGNVYAMRWGMSAWNRKIAEEDWLNGVSARYEQQLDKTTHQKPAAKGMPEIKTGLNVGADISAARFKTIFAEGTDNVLITAEEVFANPDRYYIINYERKDKYDDAHIPGAVRYKANGTLGFTDEMATIPADKTVVLYCGTGHNSAFATAYLRLLGYDARTLKYGNNAFMYDWMKKDAAGLSWLPFSEADINDYPVVR